MIVLDFCPLQDALPGASNYFLNYIAIHAAFTNWFRYFWPHDGTVLFAIFRMLGLASCTFDGVCTNSVSGDATCMGVTKLTFMPRRPQL